MGCQSNIGGVVKENMEFVGPIENGQPDYRVMNIGSLEDPYYEDPFELSVLMPGDKWQRLDQLSPMDIASNEYAETYFDSQKRPVSELPEGYFSSLRDLGANEVPAGVELHGTLDSFTVYIHPYSFWLGREGILRFHAAKKRSAQAPTPRMRIPGSSKIYSLPMSEADAIELIGGDPDRVWRSWAK